MERDKLENFINNWKGEFPDYELNAAALKDPHKLMGALVLVLDRLGIDRSILTETPEDRVNDSVPYYRDLLSVINMTRAVNHVVSVMPQVATIHMTHFLLPTVSTSHSILLLLVNLTAFNESKLRDIAPDEEQLFAHSQQVNKLAEKKYELQAKLNNQAQEKAERSERIERLDQQCKQLEEQLKAEMAACNVEQAGLDDELKEDRLMDVLLDQKRTHRDGLLADVDKKAAMRVYDADDVKAQAEQATRAVQELEERSKSLEVTLAQKQDSLLNLQTLKPSLDTANSLLSDMMKHAESLLDLECGDLECDSQEGELDVLHTELSELRAHHGELCAALDELRGRRVPHPTEHINNKQSELREATERDRKNQWRCEKAAKRIDEIKQLTLQYEEQKASGIQHITDIHNSLLERLESVHEMLMNQMTTLVKRFEKT